MTAVHHELPRDQFSALAQGGGGDAIARLVAAQRSRHRILVRAVAELARQGSGSGRGVALAGYDLLAQVERQDPGAADAVISYPSVGVWALHTLRGDQSVPGAEPSGLATVAAAAAIRAGIDAEIEVPVINGIVLLPSLGTAAATGSTAVVRTKPAEVRSTGSGRAARPGTADWLELRPAQTGSLNVLIDDVDPFRMPADDGAPAGRLSDGQLRDLVASLRAAWTVLSPAMAAEIAAIVRVIVPYQAPEEGLVSTSSPQAFGTVAMSRQPDRYTCAETLVHETQHLKLCALLDLVKLTKPDDGQRYYAPWRTDPRPASGLLQGAYAFLGVSGFWREQRHVALEPEVRQRAEADFARWRDGAALVAETLLRSGQLTAAGQDFVAEMSQVLEAWRHEQVPEEALDSARRKANSHLAQWRADNS
jgi:HEXXH motif-containing protein